MSNERKIPVPFQLTQIGGTDLNLVGDASCTLDEAGHCITCSDEALTARVVRADTQMGIAFVTINDGPEEEEIDITLIDEVGPGDLVLVHGGVAIANVDGESASTANEARHE